MYGRASKAQLPELAPLINHALLSPHVNEEEILQACDISMHFGFTGLCINLTSIPIARKGLGATRKTKLIAVIAFPFGAIPSSMKKAQAEWAASRGAEELEVVPNFSALKTGNSEIFSEELAEICSLGLPVRVIIDRVNIPSVNLKLAIEASIDAGANGIQIGNGFGPPISSNDVKELVSLSKGRCGIKAAGGIHKCEHAFDLVQAGAKLLGTSNGPELIKAIRRNQT